MSRTRRAPMATRMPDVATTAQGGDSGSVTRTHERARVEAIAAARSGPVTRRDSTVHRLTRTSWGRPPSEAMDSGWAPHGMKPPARFVLNMLRTRSPKKRGAREKPLSPPWPLPPRWPPGSSAPPVHVESDHDIAATVRAIRDVGVSPGLVLNPATPFEAAVPYLKDVDLLLVMTVHPGFAGQAFRQDVVPTIHQARADNTL